ncbi:hypothetical protein [Halopiger aswanensis]|uniref:hypothetical protein n=1 Tax=Halopiger aswanensis TaxID=148449 RepID=UPI0011C37084|nr:hypothetical protein [Halopiger aswanensis]
MVFSVLLITGAVGPAVTATRGTTAAQPATNASSVPSDATSQFLSAGGGGTALGLKYAAVSEFASITPAHKSDERRLRRAGDRINGTLDVYLDGNRVDSPAVFEGDAAAVQQLASVSDADPERVNRTTWLLAHANARTANRSIADAEVALERFSDELDDPGHRNAIESHIRNANRAYDRGQDALEADTDGDVAGASRDRSRAIRQFMTAWRQSQQALDTIQRETTPQVTVTTRGDPPRNGSDSIDGEIRGTVFDVRPHELPNATITVAGNETKTVPVEPTGYSLNATFAANVSLDERITSVEVDVSDTRPHGSPDASRAGSDTVLFDGDGLPDTYEVDVVETDPRDPDSDSPRVDADVGDNGVIDGLEDFDDDNLSNYHEGRFDTNPFASDTDGDGLPDHYEAQYPELDQTRADTNDDGVDDAEWDLDDDGLTNREEYEAETNPQLADEDRDGLDDGRELDVGTEPDNSDTDDDGLLDGEELELGTDPLAADSDGDGIADGNTTFETTIRDDETDVSLTMRGTGTAPSDVEITPKSSYFEGDDISASPTVRVVNRSDFTNATIEIPINETVPESEYENLSVFKWSGSANETWMPVESTIENGTARATVDSFSYFTVLDADEWVDATLVDETSEELPFQADANVTCNAACEVTNDSTFVLGGEPNARKITVEQGSDSFDVVPLSNGQRIEEFYDYANAQINSPLPIAESDKSQLFFWSGPEGLSLVLLHDKPSDGSGGAVTMTFDDLPTDQGNWIVRDDSGDYRHETRFDWAWNRIRTDGGVFRGGLTNQSVTINPAFNDAATRSPLDSGELTDWQVLTGRATDPRSHSLQMDEPVTVHVPEAPAMNESADAVGDSGNASVTYDLSEGTDEISVAYQTEQTNVDPNATFTVTGANGTTITESLSIGTVGTVKEVVDVSALSNGEATLTLSADGVNLRAQLLSTEAVDTDGDGIPDATERKGFLTPHGKITTDPDTADTDGDGLSDREEVGEPTSLDDVTDRLDPSSGASDRQRQRARALLDTVEAAGYDTNSTRGVYLNIASDPTAPDSDGDGLDDYTERIGKSTVVRTTSVSESKRALEGSDAETLTDAYTTYETTSNPWSADSDGDGLDDARERELATDPTGSDTDRDGIFDREEVESAGDPTLYDVRPPEIDVQNSGYHIPEMSLDTTYWVSVRIHDPAGVDRAALVKAGNEETSANYDGGETVYDYLEFTEELAESDTDVDTSTYKSTFISFGAKAVETTGSVAESVGDTTAGTTIYVETRDRNGNEDDAVGVERANFYGEAAGSLYTGTPADYVVASEFATVSGFSASLGVAFQDISQLIDDPEAVVEGIRALLDLAQSEGLGAAETLVKAMAQDVERKQAVNNPYGSLEEKEQADLYDTFRENWYEGYAAGFLAKMALDQSRSGSVKTALKSSDKVQDVGSKLSDTKALKALDRVSDAKKAAKGRATARILLAVDGDAAEPLLSQADTAGGAYRLWRHQRAMDADVDSLSDARQEQLGQYLLRTGDDGAKLVDDLDADARDEFFGAPCRRPRISGPNAEVSQQASDARLLSINCGDISEDLRDQLTVVNSRSDSFDANQFVKSTGADSRQVLERVDDATTRQMLARYGEGDIDADHLQRMNKLLDDGKMDQADIQQMMGMLKTKADNPLIEDTIQANDLLEIPEQGNDLSTTRLVVTDNNGNLRWLERGVFNPDTSNKDYGWAYLEARHIDGELMKEKRATTLWPTGQNFDSKTQPIPNSMSERDISKAIYKALEDTETTPQDSFKFSKFDQSFVDRTGVSEIEVIIRNGNVRTAYPTKGSAVWKYISQNDVGWRHEG